MTARPSRPADGVPVNWWVSPEALPAVPARLPSSRPVVAARPRHLRPVPDVPRPVPNRVGRRVRERRRRAHLARVRRRQLAAAVAAGVGLAAVVYAAVWVIDVVAAALAGWLV